MAPLACRLPARPAASLELRRGWRARHATSWWTRVPEAQRPWSSRSRAGTHLRRRPQSDREGDNDQLVRLGQRPATGDSTTANTRQQQASPARNWPSTRCSDSTPASSAEERANVERPAAAKMVTPSRYVLMKRCSPAATPRPTAFRSRALPGPPKKPFGIQNRFVLGRKNLMNEVPVVQLGRVDAVEDDRHISRDLAMQPGATQQLGQDRERQRLGRGREDAPLIDRVVGRAIGRVDRARGAGTGQVRFDVGHEVPDVGHAIAFLYGGPTTVRCGSAGRRSRVARLSACCRDDAGRSPVPQHACPNGR